MKYRKTLTEKLGTRNETLMQGGGSDSHNMSCHNACKTIFIDHRTMVMVLAKMFASTSMEDTNAHVKIYQVPIKAVLFLEWFFSIIL